ncbi:MAG: hypothetical protein WBF53_03435 [Litorimonas sp.]
MELEFVKDMLLIALCGASAFYCWMLSRRLKKLNDLKSGVGASIVTLTDAIERTHAAATTARAELFESIDEIKGLLADAEAKAMRLESAMREADGKIGEAEGANDRLRAVVDHDIPAARRKALKTTEDLLKIVSDLKRLSGDLPSPTSGASSGRNAA